MEKCVHQDKRKYCTNKYSRKYGLAISKMDCRNCNKYEPRVPKDWQERMKKV